MWGVVGEKVVVITLELRNTLLKQSINFYTWRTESKLLRVLSEYLLSVSGQEQEPGVSYAQCPLCFEQSLYPVSLLVSQCVCVACGWRFSDFHQFCVD